MVQVIVTEFGVRLTTATPEITGAGAGLVVRVAFADAEDPPAEFADTTLKSYVVLGERPVNATECAVVSVALGVEVMP